MRPPISRLSPSNDQGKVNVRPLASARQGEKVRIVAIQGGRGFRARLASMGILPGEEIEVMTNQGYGPLLLVVMDGRLTLGRGMAQKIIVR